MNELISVIIPVYNGEKFLERSIKGVLNQTVKNIELIIVDDGSTDSSGSICDAYADTNEMLHVVHKENGGISSARNAGIAVAQGEYILFLDADDYLDPETCEEIYNVICKYHPDCIDYGWKYVSTNEEVTHNIHRIPKNTLLDIKVIENDILPPLLNLRSDPDNFIYDFAWTKSFRKKIIQDNGIAFDEERRIWEDRPFVVHYLKYCKTFYSMDRCFYNYVDMPGSLSRKYSLDFFRIIIANYHHYKNLFGDRYDFDTDYVNSYWCHAIENMIFKSLEQKENREQIKKNILDALRDESVIHWFAKRMSDGSFEKKMSDYVVSGRREKALNCCEKHAKKIKRERMIRYLSEKMKSRLKKVLGIQ